uniref:NADH dehydrogenase subunit 6 n=1 Tax=Kokeshia sp. NKU02 TaxID=1124182 RepID=A0A109NGR5_9HEMI|nr:NADH dehydrogenase subunit 6 [Kokeshia sp. NKU02]
MILMMMTMSMLFMSVNHPLSMSFILIIQMLLAVMITGMIMKSFWYAYIAFMMILGGVLILFIYMASVASNEKVILMKNYLLFMLPNMLMITPYKILIEFKHNNMYKINQCEQMISLSKMFTPPTMMLTILMILMLLLTMLSVSYMINVFEGPMQMKK